MLDGGLRPWGSWVNVHADYDRIDQYPTVLLPNSYLVTVRAITGLLPASPIVVFLFFGLRREVFDEYVWAGCWIFNLLSGKPQSPRLSKSGVASSVDSLESIETV